MLKYASFIMAIIAALLCLCPSTAEACTCRGSNPGEQLDHSALVFEGRVLSVKEDPDAASLGSHVALTENEFEVIRAWKGTEAGARVIVKTPSPLSPCFEPLLVVGQFHLVYASDRDGDLVTSRCGQGTKPSEAAAEDFEVLGAPLETPCGLQDGATAGAESGCSKAEIASAPVTGGQVLLGLATLLGFAVARRGRRGDGNATQLR